MSTLWSDANPRPYLLARRIRLRVRDAWAVLTGRKVAVSLRAAVLGTQALAMELGPETRVSAMAAAEAIERMGQR